MNRSEALPPLSLLDPPPTRPQRVRDHVSLRALLESDEFQNSEPTLSIALGRTEEGNACVADLSAMPHLLIGGAPETGKRTFLNAVLTTLLLRCAPADLRLVIVDPTENALRQFEGVPHLLAPVLTEPLHALNALQCAEREMERRFRWLAAAGARSIYRYNDGQVTAAKGLADFRSGKRLHHVVLVFTELADVMGYAGADAEASIVALAQMSRAVGIHLIMATEQMSVDVVTGMLNVSLPSRMSFRTWSPYESRTMLFRGGAEQLYPRGDAFFLAPASTTPVRVYTPFVSEEEVDRVTTHWRGIVMTPNHV